MTTSDIAGNLARILVLGPIEVHVDGAALPSGGAKQRALLARLALAEGRPVLAEVLIDDVWGRHPPANARHALQAQISRLRTSMPFGVESSAAGYALPHNNIAVDAAQFAALCESGKELLANNEPRRAAEDLRTALDLWRGRIFADLGDAGGLRQFAIRLDELRRLAAADWVDACLTLGEEAKVVGHLRATLEDDPLQERAWHQLMVALYRQGRENEALAAYRQLRTVFIEELGAEPSQRLSDLHLAILDRSWPMTEAQAGTAVTAYSGQPAPGGPVPAKPAPRTRLAEKSGVNGRAAELRALEAAWDTAQRKLQVVSLTGEPGIGKTRLATAFLSQLRAAGTHVLTGRCDRSLMTPYQPFTEILREFFSTTATHTFFAGHTADSA